jgi:hypothetical protein
MLKVFENKVIRKIFGSKTEEVTEGLKKMHIEEFYDLYSSPNAIQVINLRKMRWAGHVTGMEGKINEQMPLLGT